ncbi:TonB-dependent receptor [uncultured Bacteroides sp.]|uniref:SusC/RagA family TonB-linked outer membrane protein n=1 Tax=uncultured Bacteroides sp. TaxID=162156 RepID=UPI002AA6102C|nr:TonB-dependent receptor [uncultured Bacteroides sp.]
MKKYLFIILSVISMSVYAQKITLTGKVIAANDKEPIIGATVSIKGSTIGTMTDISGNYSLSNVPNDATVIFSVIGYKKQAVNVNGQKVINVSLAEDVAVLDEIVVVGYGAVKKSDLTSSISTVKGEDIKTLSSGNAMNALQGKVNGVQISSSGGPGDVPRVIIRGVTTTNGSDPLYVVDGMPVGTNINFLSQDDIESIEVLKDASAAAIYGTRGSNGVILVSTKKGKAGKTLFQVNTSVGLQTIADPKMAGAAEYEKVFKSRYTNDGSTPIWNTPAGSTGTDWWNQVVNKTALIQNYNISFQGGTDKFIFSGSLGFFKQNSQFDTGVWDKMTGRFSTEYRFNKVIKAGIDLAPKLESWDDTPSGLFSSAMRMDPTTPVFRPEEAWVDNKYNNYQRSYNNQVWNPAGSVARQKSSSNEYGLLMTPYISVEPIKGLTIRSQFGVNSVFRISDSFVPKFYIDNLEQQELSYVERKFNSQVDWNWTNTANYMTTINKKHNINAMAGYTMEKFSNYWLTGSRENTASNITELQQVNAGTQSQKASGTNQYTTLLSYLGRAMYNYDGRYYLTTSIRVDGSSRFPAGSKYATFPAISAAWRVSGEDFMKNQELINNLKFRIGWGRVGNQNIANSAFLTLMGNADYVLGGNRIIGSAVSSVGNTSLRWETVEDHNIGLDMSMLNNRLSMTLDLFQKKSTDMLLQKENLLILGYPDWNSRIWTNVGSMKATGWEASLNWSDKKGDFSYDLGVNASSVKNKIVKLAGEAPLYTKELNSGNFIIRNEEGGYLSRFYGYTCDGIFQNQAEINAHTDEHGTIIQPYAKPGDLIFRDKNHDGVLNADDKTFIGNPFPDLMLGFNTRLGYKSFDLVANFYGTFGNDIFNTTKSLYAGTSGSNVFAGTYDKVWREDNPGATIPRLSVNDLNNNYTTVSSFFVEDGSYFRCKLLQLGYTLPKNTIKGLGVRVSLSAQNLFTLTKYSGMDPERASMGGVTESGVDNIGYPNPRTFLLGVNLNF